jgi:hypothetical protein
MVSLKEGRGSHCNAAKTCMPIGTRQKAVDQLQIAINLGFIGQLHRQKDRESLKFRTSPAD